MQLSELYCNIKLYYTCLNNFVLQLLHAKLRNVKIKK